MPSSTGNILIVRIYHD